MATCPLAQAKDRVLENLSPVRSCWCSPPPSFRTSPSVHQRARMSTYCQTSTTGSFTCRESRTLSLPAGIYIICKLHCLLPTNMEEDIFMDGRAAACWGSCSKKGISIDRVGLLFLISAPLNSREK